MPYNCSVSVGPRSIPVLASCSNFLIVVHHKGMFLQLLIAVAVDAQIDLHSRTGRDEMKRKTQERMERRSRKRSSSDGSDKMERVGDR